MGSELVEDGNSELGSLRIEISVQDLMEKMDIGVVLDGRTINPEKIILVPMKTFPRLHSFISKHK